MKLKTLLLEEEGKLSAADRRKLEKEIETRVRQELERDQDKDRKKRKQKLANIFRNGLDVKFNGKTLRLADRYGSFDLYFTLSSYKSTGLRKLLDLE